MVDAGKITGIISENTDIFVLPEQNEGDTTNRRRDFHAEARKRRIPVLSYLSVHSKDIARDAESLVSGTDP